MGKDITFEAQVRDDGEWRTVGVFADRETALSEVERALEARRTPAARVLQVIFDTDRNECTEYTVFRSSADDGLGPPKRRVNNTDIFKRHRQRPTAPAASGRSRLAIAAVALLCLAGLAATLLLR
jgi:hypothetical protein